MERRRGTILPGGGRKERIMDTQSHAKAKVDRNPVFRATLPGTNPSWYQAQPSLFSLTIHNVLG